MTTTTLTTIAAQITAAGVSAPAYADILTYFQAKYQGIYGSDIALDPSTQDGQWLAIIASAVNDCNAAVISAYNARSPASAQGAGLSSVVKINGIARHIPSASIATVTLVGQGFTGIDGGLVQDEAGNIWSLPSVIIPEAGEVDVTATCTTAGAVTAAPGTINRIYTPTLGWQSVTNAAAATPGAPVETDAALRKRQTVSTALPAQTPMQAIVGAVNAIDGVTLVKPYENNTSTTDGNGIPPWSIALVVEGGVDADVASAILAKKIPGGPTYGATTVSVTDPYGVARPIKFSRPGLIQVAGLVTLHPLTGYSSGVGDRVLQAILDYINGLDPAAIRTYPAGIAATLTGLDIGASVYRTRLFTPANLFNAADSAAYEITALTIGIAGGSLASSDISIAFNELARADLGDWAIATV